jgi:hypothetical protein
VGYPATVIKLFQVNGEHRVKTLSLLTRLVTALKHFLGAKKERKKEKRNTKSEAIEKIVQHLRNSSLNEKMVLGFCRLILSCCLIPLENRKKHVLWSKLVSEFIRGL